MEISNSCRESSIQTTPAVYPVPMPAIAPPPMTTPDALKAFGALAQESRLAIYRLLVEHAPDGLPAGVVGEVLGVPSATLSFHLKELLHAGLVTSRRDGRFVYYSAALETVDNLMSFLTANCCAASRRSRARATAAHR